MGGKELNQRIVDNVAVIPGQQYASGYYSFLLTWLVWHLMLLCGQRLAE
jgi:hypothetical protein